MESSNKPVRTKSLQKWRCLTCQFDNMGPLNACQMCQTPRIKDPKQLKEEKKIKDDSLPTIQCPNISCKHKNPLSVDECQKCHKSLFPSDEQQNKKKKDDEDVELIECRKCLFKNNPQNAVCVNCDLKLIAKRIRRKSEKPRRAAMGRRYGHLPTQPCPTCGELLRVINMSTMQTDICMKCDHLFEVKKTLCLFCDKKLTKQQEKTHDGACSQRKLFYSKENPTFDRCTKLQYQVMVYMHNKCQRLHYRREEVLRQRIEKLGYTIKDLQNLHHYIIHYAPIIIHMHVNTHFHFFLKDTHYRNQFQTSMSSGSLSHSARTGWQNRMFDHKHHSATGFQRVKYGTMNFTNDPTGVKVCAGYGQSYFLLKPHVRDRCTITDMDSSSASSTLGTFRFIFHLLMKLSDAELQSAFEGSKGKQMQSNVIGAYKQIQIHGPVQFSKDIQRVYISKQQLKLGDAKALLEQVKAFCSKNAVDYQLFQNSAPVPLMVIGAVGSLSAPAPERIVGAKKQLTEEDLKPPAPVVHSIFGGVGGFGFGGIAPPVSPFAFSFAAPVYRAPKPPEKKKYYGVDYI